MEKCETVSLLSGKQRNGTSEELKTVILPCESMFVLDEQQPKVFFKQNTPLVISDSFSPPFVRVNSVQGVPIR